MADDGCQVAARRIATDGKSIRVDAERDGVLVRPLRRLDAVVEPRRERVLRREPVADAEHGVTGAVGQRPTDVVVAVDVAEHPAAAVEPDEQPGRRQRRRRPVQPGGNAAGVDVEDLVAVLGRRPHQRLAVRPAPTRRPVPRPEGAPTWSIRSSSDDNLVVQGHRGILPLSCRRCEDVSWSPPAPRRCRRADRRSRRHRLLVATEREARRRRPDQHAGRDRRRACLHARQGRRDRHQDELEQIGEDAESGDVAAKAAANAELDKLQAELESCLE